MTGRKIIRLPVTEERTGYSRGHLLRLEKHGIFPRRIQLNPAAGAGGAVGHYEDEVDQWVRNRVRGVGRVPVARPNQAKAKSRNFTGGNDDPSPSGA